MIKPVLKTAWAVYREHFGLIAAIVLCIWTPLELVSSYCDYYVFDPDDIRGSLKLAQFLDNFFGIIATAGVTFIALSANSDSRPSFSTALASGFNCWGRMLWTRILGSIILMISFLLLIIPGVYLANRFCLAESVVVAEGLSGTTALQRSHDLTRGRFWPVFRLNALLLVCGIVILIVLVTPTILIPQLDYWLVDAATMLVTDLAAAFITLCLTSAYQRLASDTVDDIDPAQMIT